MTEYTLEENPDAKTDAKTPMEKLVLALSTADVTILDWRLARLADALHENKLAAIKTSDHPLDELQSAKPCVASIVITPIEKPREHQSR